VMLYQLVMDNSVTIMFEALRTLSLFGALPKDEAFTLPTLVNIIYAWQWLHRHTWETEWNLLMTHMQEPTHAMDEFGKLAMNLAEAKLYRERNTEPIQSKDLLSGGDSMACARGSEGDGEVARR